MVTLVVEGGATRATYASGVLDAFQTAGLVPDAFYGTSAGGVLGAWYAAGQAHLACRTWDRVTDRTLLSFRRIVIRTKPVFDFRKLYAEVYPTHFGMDVARLRRAPFPVYATVTEAETAETAYIDLRTALDPFAVLHATSALPLVSEAPILLDGRPYVDGGMTDPIPLARAIAEGHRDIVLVANRPRGERAPEPALLTRLVARRFPALALHAAHHHTYHNDAMRLAETPPTGVRVRIVRPSRETGITRVTRDPAKVRAAIQMGRADGAAAVGEILAQAGQR